MREKRKKNPTIGKLVGDCKSVGLFHLSTGNRIEFLSLKTGKCVATWFRDSQTWTSVFGNKGPAKDAFEALKQASRINRERNRELEERKEYESSQS